MTTWSQKCRAFAFEKFPGSDPSLGPQMKSVGEAMSIGRTFRESFGKALRSLEIGRWGFDLENAPSLEDLKPRLNSPDPDRLWNLGEALRQGLSLEEAHQLTSIDPWFLEQVQDIVQMDKHIGETKGFLDDAEGLRRAKELGISDRRIMKLQGCNEETVRQARIQHNIRPVFKRVDTCAAEFEARTPYLYSTYETGTADAPASAENESRPTDKKKIVILGGGPNRIGQGIEFDYCCVHAVKALEAEGCETIMVNCNPETVSTDYDTSDRLYFEPLTREDVLEILDGEKPDGVIVQFGGQTPLRLAVPLQEAGVKLLGTPLTPSTAPRTASVLATWSINWD